MRLPEKMSSWSDLPRRLTTISVAVPIILSILTNPTYTFYLIQLSHLICAIEWIRLNPNTNKELSTDVASFQDKAKNEIWFSHADSVCFILASLYIGTPPSVMKFQFHHCPPPLSVLLPFLFFFLTLRSSLCKDSKKVPILSTHCVNGFLFLSLGYYHLHLIYNYSIIHAVQFLFVVWNSDTGALIFGRLWKGDPVGVKLGVRWIQSLKKISTKKSYTGMGKKNSMKVAFINLCSGFFIKLDCNF